jgi:hypothetical protein
MRLSEITANSEFETTFAIPTAMALPRPRWDDRLARWVSDILSPPVTATAGLLLVARAIATPAAWGWASFYMALVVLVPTLYVIRLLRRGEVTDFHLRVREQRIKPLLVIMAAMIVAWLALLVGDAPRLLLALASAGTVQALIIFLVTLRWKISGHAAAITGLAVLSWLLTSPVAAPAALSVPLVIWARLQLRRHTLPQTLAGATVGALISVAVYLTGR